MIHLIQFHSFNSRSFWLKKEDKNITEFYLVLLFMYNLNFDFSVFLSIFNFFYKSIPTRVYLFRIKSILLNASTIPKIKKYFSSLIFKITAIELYNNKGF